MLLTDAAGRRFRHDGAMLMDAVSCPDQSGPPVARFNRGSVLPWLSLASVPTPLARLPRLSAHYGLSELWIKRDDLSSPLYGGNKVRKLEFLLADALKKQASTLVTVGAVGSHHILATARFGREVNLPTTAVVVHQPVTPHVGENLQLGLHWGVRYVLARHPALLPVRVLAERAAGHGGYYIPAGGSSVLGTLGYVNAALELADQIRAGEMPRPQAIFVALGSGGTHAGLVAGLALARLSVPVIGVRVVPDYLVPERRVTGLATAVLRRLGHTTRGVALPIHIANDQLGAGYGHPTPDAEDALAACQALEDLKLESTYTAKCLAGAITWARARGLSRGPLLYWNTFDGADHAHELALAKAGMASPPSGLERYFEI